MLETTEELDNLQQLLDRSMEGAGEHLRGIITGERRLSAADLAGRLQGMRLLTVATVTADGRPQAGRNSSGTCASSSSMPPSFPCGGRVSSSPR